MWTPPPKECPWGLSHWVPFPRLSSRKPRGEGKKCRKVYGMENRDMWCTACRWKKACQRFTDWSPGHPPAGLASHTLLPSPSAEGSGKRFSFWTKHTWSPGKALPGSLVKLQQKHSKWKGHRSYCSCWESIRQQLELFFSSLKSKVNCFFSVCLGLKTVGCCSHWTNQAHFT